jgi:hypothetical protein
VAVVVAVVAKAAAVAVINRFSPHLHFRV